MLMFPKGFNDNVIICDDGGLTGDLAADPAHAPLVREDPLPTEPVGAQLDHQVAEAAWDKLHCCKEIGVPTSA